MRCVFAWSTVSESAAQPVKAPALTVTTEAGSCSSVSDLQLLNALLPMVRRPSGRTRLLSAVHPLNSEELIAVRAAGSVMLWREKQFWNALDAVELIPSGRSSAVSEPQL